MNNMLVSTDLRPSLCSSLTSTVCGSMSAKKRLMPSVFFSTSSNGVVRVSSSIFLDSCALVMKTFRPFTR